MAHIVLGIGTSHTPMLNAPVADWSRFIERDRLRPHLTKDGRPVSYAELVQLAPADMAANLTPEVFADKHQRALAEVERLGAVVRNARLDTLIVVGDDQKELYDDANMPAVLLYRGESIRKVPLASHPGPDWARQASARYFEAERPRDYPVDARLAEHLIASLMEDFDLSCANTLAEGYGEGHAFGFVHNRLLAGMTIPVVPVFLNTYYPPNQPSPAGSALADDTSNSASTMVALSLPISTFSAAIRRRTVASSGSLSRAASSFSTLRRSSRDGGIREICSRSASCFTHALSGSWS